MPYTTYWNKIVSQVNKNMNSKEEIVQTSWELLFSTIFDYSDSEIDPQRPVQMGVATKRADIVIKDGNSDLFVVELKRHMLHEGQEQLFSYLNQLKIDLGILVCDKLYIYDYDYTSKDNTYSFLEIPFTPDNPNGSRFVELFSKDNFDKQKIRDFIKESNNKKNAESEIKNELSSNLLMELLKNHFSNKYPIADVEKILSGYTFSIAEKNISPIPAISTTMTPKGKYSYFYNNKNFSKRKLVLAVVTDYVKNNPKITYEQLKSVFPDKLQGNFGVFQDDATVFQTTLAKVNNKEKEYKKRYFSNPNDKIYLETDEKTIIVSGEWGDNFDDFFNHAKVLGLNVEKKNT